MNSIETSNPLQDLAQQLVQKFDTNGDGSLTTQEFTTFLTTFMGTLGTGYTGGGTGGTTTTGTTSAGSGIGRGQMEGFDFNKIGDPSVTTVKYKFARVAQNYGLSSVSDMSSAQSLLNQMTPELQAAGITVLGVEKDKIQVLDDAGQPAWIDVIRGAGGANPAWQWLDQRF
ncbi:MAG: hypothetical protein AB7O67_15090 [Vicinamibacterales bacterium]